eukprot:TRINITY_DN19856_c0_g1_i1.p1 TRINITY_DN19856_c0_g1~~TRINITY_DN19856_c0_g1_i1.p1  ORF type:complete len:359 (+),score=103.01 TRINITY_DN19856_c0_g1_i1:115-1077(+)
MPVVQGYTFEKEEAGEAVRWEEVGKALNDVGMQASEMGRAVQEVVGMVKRRREQGEKIVLAFTSNLISSGLRDMFTMMAREKMMDVVVTTAGGVEEDFIKCLGPTVLGDFALDGADLRSKGLNRIANLLVPNDNYCKFEDWMKPILDAMKEEQDKDNAAWTPSTMIDRFGKDIKDPTSFYNQCHEGNIPVFCPSLSDGSIGDMLFFHAFKNPGLVLDTAGDLNRIAGCLKGAQKVNVICLGGGLPKHHSLQAVRLAQSALSSLVLINTGPQFDGSETGMSEANDKSEGRIAKDSTVIRLHSEATLVFPIIMQRALAQLAN